jgi:DNA-binding XRE family transcriptional regulator
MGLRERYSLQKLSAHNGLQQETSAAVISVSEQTLVAFVQNSRRRLQMVLDADVPHIENVVT